MPPPRAISSATISFGLVSIPVKVYTATSSQSVRFNMLHDECGSRVKQQLYCPVDDAVVDRSDTVKGYEYQKGQFVRFDAEELKKLEAEKTTAIEILEFVPLDTIDLIQIEKSYYLGPDKGGDKAYSLLSSAMGRTGKIAVGRHWTRGKAQLVLIRPYRAGLLLHQVYYADEVRSFADLEVDDAPALREGEAELADQLIEQLATERFEPSKYRDEYRDRVLAAVEQKVAGQEITVAPEAPTAQIIDLFEALKASLGEVKGPAKSVPPEGAQSGRGKKVRAARKRRTGKASRRKTGSD